MEIIKQVNGFKRTLNGKVLIHPLYNRRFNIEINPTKEIFVRKKIICPNCNAEKIFITKTGTRKNKRNKINIQRFNCNWCEKKFTLKDDIYRMRNNKKTIDEALLLRQQGFTLRDIQNKLNKKVSHVTILRWIKKWEKKK